MSTPSLYARIVNGAVAEPLFTLPAGSTIEQCFVSVIAAEFVAVPAGVTPAPGWLYDGTTFTAPPAPTRTLAQQAQAALGAGLAVVSTGTPALNGTYALGSTTQLRMASLLQYYDKFGTFPNANASQVVVDASGGQHTFTPAQFESLYQSLGNYLTALEDAILGISTTLPDPSKFGSIP